VDEKAATSAGIIVGHVPVYCVDEVSTHAIAMLLNSVRRIRPTQMKMEQGEWDVHRNDPIYRLEGKTLGLIGLGNIGRAVARKLSAWEIRLMAFDPYADAGQASMMDVDLVDLDTLCRNSDLISIHCPLLPETRHLIDAQKLALMKSTAVLVNTARGPIVDTKALLSALNEGRLAAAGLDVFEEEPLPKNSPLRHHPQLVVSDHTAWYSEESQADLQRKAAEEVARVCTGAMPFSLANPEVLPRLRNAAKWPVPEHVKWQLKRQEYLDVKTDILKT
jgi:D-3-phosphoglycerate dehydrogenase